MHSVNIQHMADYYSIIPIIILPSITLFQNIFSLIFYQAASNSLNPLAQKAVQASKPTPSQKYSSLLPHISLLICWQSLCSHLD
jgi:hypothetical protein